MTVPIAEPEATVDQRGLVERAQRGDHAAFALLAGATIVRLDAADSSDRSPPQVLLEVESGDLVEIPWETTSDPAWQRLPSN